MACVARGLVLLPPAAVGAGIPVHLPRLHLAASSRCLTRLQGPGTTASERWHDRPSLHALPTNSPGSPLQPTAPSSAPSRLQVTATSQQQQPQQQEDDFSGLMPDEDQQVPGGYEEAMNGNTRLGKAVRAACSELQHLNKMELSNLQEAEKLLKMLGVKTPLVSEEQQQAIVEQFVEDEQSGS